MLIVSRIRMSVRLGCVYRAGLKQKKGAVRITVLLILIYYFTPRALVRIFVS